MKTYTGSEAELLAVSRGIRADLVKRVSRKRVTPDGVLTTIAFIEDGWIYVGLYPDGSFNWMAQTGPGALESGAMKWSKLAPKSLVPVTSAIVEYPNPDQN